MIKNPSCILLVAVFLVSATAFSIKNADAYVPADSKQYAYYAGLAYCGKKCLQKWDCKGGKDLTNFGEVTHVNNLITVASAYIGYERVKNKIIVSFRGSANARNWIQDFNFQKIKYNCKDCWIHQGFFQDYHLIEDKINQAVEKLLQKHTTATILTTGHSMGAALSEVAGFRLKAKFGQKVQVHNFGCPRIGNQAMAQYIARKVDTLYRVVHNRDLVPHIPFEQMAYKHSPFQVFWDQHFSQHKICDGSGQDKSCSDQYFPDYSIGDHDIYFIPLSSLKC